MTPEVLFSLCFGFVLPGWLLLVLAPRWRWTQRLILLVILPLLAAIYLFLIVAHFGKIAGGFESLKTCTTCAGWIHYLMFDLFVGTWEALDARRLGMPQFLVLPCLLLTFVFGPIGLLSYFLLRWKTRREFVIEVGDKNTHTLGAGSSR